MSHKLISELDLGRKHMESMICSTNKERDAFEHEDIYREAVDKHNQAETFYPLPCTVVSPTAFSRNIRSQPPLLPPLSNAIYR